MSFRRFAWISLAYTVAVIMWGSYVRASGSGAGCGRHWPLCNGTAVPRAPELATLIEFTHRITSGICLVLAVVLFFWARRVTAEQFKQGRSSESPHSEGARRLRHAASAVLVFTVFEALVGAGLVLFELVAENASSARAIVIALHLVNTLFLLAALALTAWWSDPQTWERSYKKSSQSSILLIALLGLLFTAASGAVTALGDTLFPAASLLDGIRQDFSPGAQFLVKLRIWHPMIAVLCACLLIWFTYTLLERKSTSAQRASLARLLMYLIFGQILVGVLNLLLLVPTALQLLHLALADGIWIVAVILYEETMAEGSRIQSSFMPQTLDATVRT